MVMGRFDMRDEGLRPSARKVDHDKCDVGDHVGDHVGEASLLGGMMHRDCGMTGAL